AVHDLAVLLNGLRGHGIQSRRPIIVLTTSTPGGHCHEQGKSRLVQVLKDQVATEPQAWLTPCQCSPYYQHSALYPMIDLLERVALRFEREESPQQKLRKLEGFLVQYGLSLAEVVPLFAALL